MKILKKSKLNENAPTRRNSYTDYYFSDWLRSKALNSKQCSIMDYDCIANDNIVTTEYDEVYNITKYKGTDEEILNDNESKFNLMLEVKQYKRVPTTAQIITYSKLSDSLFLNNAINRKSKGELFLGAYSLIFEKDRFDTGNAWLSLIKSNNNDWFKTKVSEEDMIDVLNFKIGSSKFDDMTTNANKITAQVLSQHQFKFKKIDYSKMSREELLDVLDIIQSDYITIKK